MLILTMLSFLVGVVIGLRFKVFILIPTTGLALAIVAVSGVGVGDGTWQLIGTMAVVATFIQLGYLGGSVFQSVSFGMRSTGLNREPICPSTEVPPSGQSRNLGGASSRFETSKQLRRA